MGEWPGVSRLKSPTAGSGAQQCLFGAERLAAAGPVLSSVVEEKTWRVPSSVFQHQMVAGPVGVHPDATGFTPWCAKS